MRRPFAALRSFAAALTLVTASATAAAAQRVLINFSEFRSDTTAEYQATPGGDVVSKGYEFWNNTQQPNYSGDPRNALATWGTNATLDPIGAEIIEAPVYCWSALSRRDSTSTGASNGSGSRARVSCERATSTSGASGS